MSKSWLYEWADYCLRVSLYRTGKSFQHRDTVWDIGQTQQMIKICRLDKLFGHRKSDEYRWSNSDGITKWIYEKVLKRFGINPYKGLNGDQYRGFFTYMYLMKRKDYARNIFLGFLFRLGLTPSLMEWAPLKPQAYVLLLKMCPLLYPLYVVSRLSFSMTVWYELKFVPIEKSTTNKISMLPTMKILGMKLPSKEYISQVYQTYFRADPIGVEMVKGLLYSEIGE